MATKPASPFGDFFTGSTSFNFDGDFFGPIMNTSLGGFDGLMSAVFAMIGDEDFSTGYDPSNFSPFATPAPGIGKPKPPIQWGPNGRGDAPAHKFKRGDDQVSLWSDGWQMVEHPNGTKSLIAPDGTKYKWDEKKGNWAWVTNAPKPLGTPKAPIKWGENGPGGTPKATYFHGDIKVTEFDQGWRTFVHPDGTRQLLEGDGTVYEWNKTTNQWDWVSSPTPTGAHTLPQPPLPWGENGPNSPSKPPYRVGDTTVTLFDDGWKMVVYDDGTRELSDKNGTLYRYDDKNKQWDWIAPGGGTTFITPPPGSNNSNSPAGAPVVAEGPGYGTGAGTKDSPTGGPTIQVNWVEHEKKFPSPTYTQLDYKISYMEYSDGTGYWVDPDGTKTIYMPNGDVYTSIGGIWTKLGQGCPGRPRVDGDLIKYWVVENGVWVERQRTRQKDFLTGGYPDSTPKKRPVRP